MADEVKSKDGEQIKPGDYVEGKIRGGSHRGNVDEIVTTKEEAEERDVKNPPKVLFSDQHGHNVARNPESLSKKEPSE